MSRRALLAVAGLALTAAAAAAHAYVSPPEAILKRAADRRSALELVAVEATGTLELRGAAVERLPPALAPVTGGAASFPARIVVKVPGRVRVEATAGGSEAERPVATLREEKLGGRALDQTPAVVALVRALGTLLATPGGGEGQPLGQALVRRGVAIADASLGRFNGRLAWVLGARGREARPAAAFDKDTAMPLRLLFVEGGELRDVRLVDWGSPTGGDWFPRAVEVWSGGELQLRFSTEKAIANPEVADSQF